MAQTTSSIWENAGSDELKDLLNEAIAGELQVSIQYMWQHVSWKGAKAFASNGELKAIAITEMRHAEALAERLDYLGGTPTTKPAEIKVGGDDLWQQMKNDVEAEANTINRYNRIIQLCEKVGDVTTRTLVEGILREEEEHHDFFSSILKDSEAGKAK